MHDRGFTKHRMAKERKKRKEGIEKRSRQLFQE